MDSISRRKALGAAGLAAAAGGLALSSHNQGLAGALRDEPSLDAHAVGDQHQRGVIDYPEAPFCASYFAVDFIVTSKGELRDALRGLTGAVRQLATGIAGGASSPSEIPADDGTLGAGKVGIPLVTVALGASLLKRPDLARSRPADFPEMRPLPGDALDPAQSQGDVGVLVQAGDRDVVAHAVREIIRAVEGYMLIRWRVDGYRAGPRPAGPGRNLFGFQDGISNPDVTNLAQMRDLVWIDASDSQGDWLGGGSFQVVRKIRMDTQLWQQLSLQSQEKIIGRQKESGAFIGRTYIDQAPLYNIDPAGNYVPLSAHVRRANPRIPGSERRRILRRGFNYDGGITSEGLLDQGLLFICYQRNIRRQFEKVQTALLGEPMAELTSVTGGGYFVVLPPLHGTQDWYGRALTE
jgi:deferrochelatase/peroxidase EfeB